MIEQLLLNIVLLVVIVTHSSCSFFPITGHSFVLFFFSLPSQPLIAIAMALHCHLLPGWLDRLPCLEDYQAAAEILPSSRFLSLSRFSFRIPFLILILDQHLLPFIIHPSIQKEKETVLLQHHLLGIEDLSL